MPNLEDILQEAFAGIKISDRKFSRVRSEIEELIDDECDQAADAAIDEFQCDCDPDGAWDEGYESAFEAAYQNFRDRLEDLHALLKGGDVPECLIEIERMVGDAGGHI